MISLMLIAFEGMFNAAMDVLQFNFSTSVFRNKDILFWNPAFSWKRKYENAVTGILGLKLIFPPDAFSDAWHIFKLLQLTCIMFAIIFYKSISGSFLYDLLILATVRYLVFNLFYKIILRKDK